MLQAIGSRLGPYEILAQLGAGGMGEVYKARDTRLDRVVAIKLSKEQFSDRFEREAKAVAALNHPYISQLYDVGPNYLVMEFVEGETLQGPLPLEEALRIAGQIADALEAAHEKGIVHRDLKPGNILIKADGSVKLLDFGLAKIAPAIDSSSACDDSLTLGKAPTQAGTILGTAAYMSPEQARGKNVTTGADIWAFGVVLYETLTGRQLFNGEDLTEVLASVVKEEPDLKAAPQEVQPLLEACLQKDPKKRLRAIGDWRLLLRRPPAVAAVANRASWLWPAIAGLLAIVAGYVSFLHFRENSPLAGSLRLSVSLPPGAQPSYVLLSPDGRRLLVNLLSQNKTLLYTRPLDSAELHPLEGTGDARSPFWSADGRFIGFFADGKLKMIPAAGGPASVLCSETGLGGGGGAWSRANVVLFFTDTGIAHRVSSAGGECLPVKLGDESLRGSLPEFLPDGNHFFFLGAGRVDSTIRGVYIGSLDGAKPRKVLNDYSSVLYSPPLPGAGSAHLLFLRASTLMAQPFDPEKLEVMGDPFVVATPASISLTPNQMAASAANGTLVYLNSRSRNLQLTWFDRSGKELGKLGEPAERIGISLSPDGSTVAFRERTQTDPLGGIGLSDLVRNSESRFTPDGRTANAAVWSPDGAHIVYSASDSAGTNLFMRNANGEGPETRLLPPGPNIRNASDWSADGRFLIYTEFEPKTGSHIWYLPNPGKPEAMPVRFLSPDVVGTEGQLSPDGHWIAYSSSPDVVYVRAFPSGDRLTKIADNAIEPRWSKNGRELFYLEFVNGANEVNLMQVTFSAGAGGSPQIGEPRKIMNFQSRVIFPQNNQFAYSPHPDGKRFLVNVRPLDASSEINVITNWQKVSGSGKP